MRGIVIRSFEAQLQGKTIRASEGEEIEIIDHSWITSGLVVPVRGAAERAVARPPEKGVSHGT